MPDRQLLGHAHAAVQLHGLAGELDPARAADIGNEIDRRLWAQLPSIPLYPLPGFLAWRQDLVNVEHNTTTEGPFWNVGTWGFATS
jgi:peptide/nickel transport system substrate-binding protein